MRYPEFLEPGGRIGFIAPSFGVATEPYSTRFDEALKLFSGMGYKTVVGPNCRASEGVGKSNTAEACGEEINDFFINDRSDIILSVGGGETMCEDLPFVDFEAIAKAKPKWFMGYSDNTNLVLPLVTMCDTAAIYGPCAGAFGTDPWHESVTDAFMTVCGTCPTVCSYNGWEKQELPDAAPTATYNITEPFRIKYAGCESRKASFSGRLIGGCLDVLSVLCGTRFDHVREFSERYKEDGIIWVLEACDLNPMSIRRALWQLENAGWFENVRGFLIGRALHYDEEIMGVNRINAVTEVLNKYNVPVLMDLDIGHLPPMMPLVMGSLAHVGAEVNSLAIRQELI